MSKVSLMFFGWNLTLVLLIIFGHQTVAVDAQSLPETSVVILVDMSASFAPLKEEDRQALDGIAQAVVEMMLQEWDQPVSLFWAKIGSSSLHAIPPCGKAVQYRSRVVVPGAKKKGKASSELYSESELRAWFEACILRLTGDKIPVDQYTDISGAIELAAESARGIRKLKILIILSDFAEDLPRGRTPVRFKMSSERVIMVYRPEPSDEKDLNQMLNRLADWGNRLRAAGARDVCRVPVMGLLPASIVRCLTP